MKIDLILFILTKIKFKFIKFEFIYFYFLVDFR